MPSPDNTTNPILKRCTSCGRELPLSEFWKSRRNQDKRRSCCIDCEYRKLNRPRPVRRLLTDGKKQCSICGQIKDADCFHKKPTSKDGFRSDCKDCVRSRNKQWQQANSDKIKEYNRHRQRNPEKEQERSRLYREQHPEKCRASSLQYYYRNIDRLKPIYRDRARQQYHKDIIQSREAALLYRQRNPGKVKVAKHTRRAREKLLPNCLTNADWLHCLDYFGHCCAACGRPAGLWHTIAMDHWIPVSASKCPGTVPDNIVPLCHSQRDGENGCNNSKLNRDPVEWLIDRFGQHKARRILKRINAYFNSLKG